MAAMARGHAVLAAGLVSLLAVAVARTESADDASENMQEHFGTFLQEYLPPGDDKYTESWTGDNSSWRNYMDKFGGSNAGYSHYLHQFGGSQADYGQYVSLYSSMAGSGVTSGNDYNSKGKSQLASWNKTMAKTYDKYIPGSYEHFAMQATQERAAGKTPDEGGAQNAGMGGGAGGGAGGGSGGGGAAGGGAAGGAGNSGSGGHEGGEGSKQGENEGGEQHEVGYKRFAEPYVSEYATDEGEHNAFDYEGKEFASAGMDMGSVGDYSNYVENYAGSWVPEGSASVAQPSKPVAMEAISLPASQPLDKASQLTGESGATPANLESVRQAVMRVEASVTELHRAASDKAYADWTISRHLPQQGLSKVHDEESRKILQKAMAQLKGLGKAARVQQLEESNQVAGFAISRLGKAESEALKRRAATARQTSLQSVRRWQDAISVSAEAARAAAELEAQAFPDVLALKELVLRCKVLSEQARTDGEELRRSLEDALGRAVHSAQVALSQRAQTRQNRLHALLETPDVTAMDAQTRQALRSEGSSPASGSHSDSFSAMLAAFNTWSLKAVPAPVLLVAISVAGVVCSIAGVSSRLHGRSRNTRSSQSLAEVPLLSLA
eukprot:TRINITY_DN27329_c0_g1_i1.p1 TRINITY_DN27329_c0_g1~~TRINITY_DN27329_c0_g1_i1.p1  ORF type:complete len:610 (-),score=137.58 TRINITY_DN27329_c0_g1_i1:416-2245(-)